MSSRSGNKTKLFLKFFLGANVILCIIGVYTIFQSSGRTAETTSHHYKDSHSRNLLQSFSNQETCDCSKYKLPAKVNISVSDLGKDFADTGQSAGLNRFKSPPVKIGEDFDSSKEFQVPNIVHYIWYNTERKFFQFHHMLSVLSASKFIQPDVIYFHTDNEPKGEFWERTKQIKNFKVVHRNPPTRLFGEDVTPPKFYTSHSNVDRVKVLMEYGGIYLDFDVFATRSFDDLRKHPCTIGFESEEKSCGSVIVSSKDAFFLIIWLNSYFDDYRADEWAYNTGKVPFKLAKRFPHLVHVERTKLNRPNFFELNLLYGDKTWKWRDNYAVHTWYRLWKDWSGMFKGVEPDMSNIKTLNNTFGQIARTILYDTEDIVK